MELAPLTPADRRRFQIGGGFREVHPLHGAHPMATTSDLPMNGV